MVDPKKAVSIDSPPLQNKWLAAGGKHPREVSREKKIAFIAALIEHGNVTKAAIAAGYENGFTAHLYALRKADQEFREAWEYAAEAGRQRVRDEIDDKIVERGVHGYEKPVWYKGEEVGTEHVYDSNLLVLAAKTWNPEKYRENRDAQQITINANVGVAVMPAAAASEDDWEKDSLRLTDMQSKIAKAALAGGGKVIDGTAEKVETIKRGG